MAAPSRSNAPFEGARADERRLRASASAATTPTTLSTRQLIIAAGLGAQACARAIEDFPADRIPHALFRQGQLLRAARRRRRRSRGSSIRRPFPARSARTIAAISAASRASARISNSSITKTTSSIPRAPRASTQPSAASGLALPDGALQPDYAGIRPKLHGPGEPQGDFVIDDTHRQPLCLFGIESPGLTSSLAIGEEVARRFGG